MRLRRFRILELAENRGYVDESGRVSQKMLAGALGVTEVWLSAVLNGRRTPSFDLLERMCSTLDCTLDEIMLYPNVEALVPA